MNERGVEYGGMTSFQNDPAPVRLVPSPYPCRASMRALHSRSIRQNWRKSPSPRIWGKIEHGNAPRNIHTAPRSDYLFLVRG